MTKIMILGTFHMQAKNDMKNFQQTERIKEQEREIRQIVEAITKFKPSKIAVEHCKSQQNTLDEAYANYLLSGLASPDEVEQIAFPLAKSLGLKRVNAVDWMELGAAEHGCGEVLEYLYSKQPELSREIDAFEDTAVDLEKETLYDAFLRLNSPNSVKNTLAYYMNYARIGSEEYYGNGWLIWWYQRNLNIFTNIAALSTGEDDERILLLIGAAHKGILEQFFRNSMVFEVVDSSVYLTNSNLPCCC